MDLGNVVYVALTGAVTLGTIIGYGKGFLRSHGKHRKPVALESVTYLTELANER